MSFQFQYTPCFEIDFEDAFLLSQPLHFHEIYTYQLLALIYQYLKTTIPAVLECAISIDSTF